jgi:NADP-dependent 3-hydroxy acid dehydrogenase YdfG/acyl carrier protein
VLCDDRISSPEYWVDHILATVNFVSCMGTLSSVGVNSYIELGPDAVLLGMGSLCVEDSGSSLWLPSLRKQRDDHAVLCDSVGRYYVNGGEPDWGGYYAGREGLRVQLPGYAFQRQRYWIRAGGHTKTDINFFEVSSVAYPLTGLKLKSPEDTQAQYVLNINKTDYPYLYDHVVYGKPVMAGAFYVSVLLSIGAGEYKTDQLTLSDIEMYRPLFLKERLTIYTLLKSVTSVSCEACLYTKEGEEWLLHCKGYINIESEGIGNADHLFMPLPEQFDEKASAGVIYERLSARLNVDWLDKWRWTSVCYTGKDNTLHQLVAPQGERYTESPVHPALIDNCFAAGIGLFEDAFFSAADSSMLPFGVDRFVLYKAVTGAVWCEYRTRNEGSSPELILSDMFLWDEEGSLVAEIRGFVSKLATKKIFLSFELENAIRKDWFFKTAWSRIELTPVSVLTNPGRWFILSSGNNIGQMKILEKSFAQLGIAAVCTTDITASLNELHNEEIAGIVVLWQGDNGGDIIERAKYHALSGLRQLQQITAATAANNIRLKGIWWVIQHVHESGSINGIGLTQSPLWGLGRVFMQEQPDVPLRMIDDMSTDQSFAGLVRVITGNTDENQLQVTDEGVYAFRFVADNALKESATISKPVFSRTDCTILITGGLTGIGLETARHLSKEYHIRHLLLLGRRDPGREAMSLFEELEKEGTIITVAKGDVSDKTQIEAILSKIPEQYPLKGIVHSAGLLDDGMIAMQNEDRFNAVLKPKIDGSWNLHEISLSFDLDVFVLFSSVASIFGPAGQSNYASANAFLDSLADYRKQLRLPVHVINWGPWASVGMADKLNPQAKGRLLRQGIGDIQLKQGIRSLFLILSNVPGKYIVLPINLEKAGTFYEETFGAIPLIFRDVIKSRTAKAIISGNTFVERLRPLPPEKRVEEVNILIQKEVARTLAVDEYRNVSINQSLLEQGVDSLMAVELKNSLTKITGKPIPITVLFQHPVITDLSLILLNEYFDFSTQVGNTTNAVSHSIKPDERQNADVEHRSTVALSSMQERLWFITQSTEVKQLYNLYYELNFTGVLSLSKLGACIFTLIQRQESLRSSISTGSDGISLVRIQDPWAPDLDVIDLSHLSGDDRTSAIHSFRVKRMNTHFDFSTPSILFDVIKLENDLFKIAITQSHLFSDGWSCIVLIRELIEVYNAFEDGKPYPLAPLRYQYADFARWEQKRIEAGEFATSKQYWLKKLQNLPALRLPVDHPYPEIKRFNGSCEKSYLSTEKAQLLFELCKKEGVTLPVLLITAYSVLLHSLTGQDDFAIGTVNANRNIDGIEHTVGFFVNTVVLRCELSMTQTFSEYLANMKQVVHESIAHHEIPFGEVVKALAQGRSLGKTPLYNVSFVMESFYFIKRNEPQQQKWSVDVLKADASIEGKTNDDLSLIASEIDGDISFDLNYNTDIFKKETIKRMMTDFMALLELIQDNPDQQLAYYPFTIQERNERNAVDVFINQLNTHSSKGKNILEF